jgi:EAL domain-containing protein (putative c-di-GMP-specific phosphodiesterase class I)
VSSQSFYSDPLLDGLERVFAVPPHLAGRLGIEITERAPLRDYDRAQRRLTALRSLGCLVAIDDFGTGFSSFEHLRRLPVETHDTVRVLGTKNIEYGQGYLYGRPRPAPATLVESDPAHLALA